jgi:hypothetical protein
MIKNNVIITVLSFFDTECPHLDSRTWSSVMVPAVAEYAREKSHTTLFVTSGTKRAQSE